MGFVQIITANTSMSMAIDELENLTIQSAAGILFYFLPNIHRLCIRKQSIRPVSYTHLHHSQTRRRQISTFHGADDRFVIGTQILSKPFLFRNGKVFRRKI